MLIKVSKFCCPVLATVQFYLLFYYTGAIEKG